MTSFTTAPRALMVGAALLGALATPAYAQTNPAPASAPLTAPKGALTGTMQQVMRGIFFPNANMIFNVQSHDPADKKPLAGSAPGGSDFNWVQWGQGLYTGWEDVDYAAVALAEISPALLTPGRTCENGTPVPVDRADWIKFTSGMVDAAKKVLEASKTRSMDAVSDSTNDLNDACQACHRVYRRGPVTESGNAASIALRCMAP